MVQSRPMKRGVECGGNVLGVKERDAHPKVGGATGFFFSSEGRINITLESPMPPSNQNRI